MNKASLQFYLNIRIYSWSIDSIGIESLGSNPDNNRSCNVRLQHSAARFPLDLIVGEGWRWSNNHGQKSFRRPFRVFSDFRPEIDWLSAISSLWTERGGIILSTEGQQRHVSHCASKIVKCRHIYNKWHDLNVDIWISSIWSLLCSSSFACFRGIGLLGHTADQRRSKFGTERSCDTLLSTVL